MPTTSPLFDEIYAVGDSLSDSGGIYQLSSLALSKVPQDLIDGLQPIPIPPYVMKFSDGPVLPEITAKLLGATLHNFSFGGAEAVGENSLLDIAPPALRAAIDALPDSVQAQVGARPCNRPSRTAQGPQRRAPGTAAGGFGAREPDRAQ